MENVLELVIDAEELAKVDDAIDHGAPSFTAKTLSVTHPVPGAIGRGPNYIELRHSLGETNHRLELTLPGGSAPQVILLPERWASRARSLISNHPGSSEFANSFDTQCYFLSVDALDLRAPLRDIVQDCAADIQASMIRPQVTTLNPMDCARACTPYNPNGLPVQVTPGETDPEIIAKAAELNAGIAKSLADRAHLAPTSAGASDLKEVLVNAGNGDQRVSCDLRKDAQPAKSKVEPVRSARDEEDEKVRKGLEGMISGIGRAMDGIRKKPLTIPPEGLCAAISRDLKKIRAHRERVAGSINGLSPSLCRETIEHMKAFLDHLDEQQARLQELPALRDAAHYGL